MDYRVIRSGRKTLALQIKNGELIVRAPYFTTEKKINDFVSSHTAWIEKRMMKNREEVVPFTDEELSFLYKKAKAYLPERVEYYASLLDVTYNRITIRAQRTRWGSCSSKKNLNFNCLLMLAPLEVIDSVVVHEVCHLKEMNHSKKFYSLVESVYPEYKKHHAWLMTNGDALIRRI